MASKRNVTREEDQSSERKTVFSEKANGTKQEHRRPTRKLKNLEENSNNLRWMIFVLVFSLAILGLIYYYNYYQPTPANTKTNSTGSHKPKNQQSKAGKSSQSASKKEKKKTVQEKKPKATPPSKTKEQKKKKSESKANTTPGSKQDQKPKKQPSTTEKPSHTNQKKRAERLSIFPKSVRDRLLRLPVPPSDSDRPYIMEIVAADDFLVDKDYSKALEKFNEILKRLPQSPRGLYGKAIALEHISEKRNNLKVLDNAIEYYRKVGVESFLAPAAIKEAALIRLVTLQNKRGKYVEAIKGCLKLCEMDPDNDGYATQLGLTYIKANKLKEAKEQLQKTVEKWPENGVAEANLGYLFYLDGDCVTGLPLLVAGLEKDQGIKNNPMFYRYAGDCLVKLNLYKESLELYKMAIDLKLFPSLWQRPLDNVEGLRAQPWWEVGDTGSKEELERMVDQLETVKSELLSVVSDGKFIGTSTSDQSVWTLYANGESNKPNCHVTPRSCDLIDSITLAAKCTKGESKALLLPPSLHIPPHVGSTNTKLRAIVPLKLNGSLKIRVADETRELEEGVLSVFDDSFEQEVWHISEESSLVLIVEFWHPDVSVEKRTVTN